MKRIFICLVLILVTLSLGCVDSPKSQKSDIIQKPIQQPQQSIQQPKQPQQSIEIKFATLTRNNIGEYSQAPTGKIYLIVSMEIKNNGYEKFSVNPLYFSLISNNIKYNYSPATYSLSDKIEPVDILDGGTITGSIAFEVPKDTTDYQLQYSGFESYNIIYTPIP